MKVKRIIAGTLLATGIVSFGHNASAEDLWDIYQLALTNDAQYLAAAANYEAARLDLPLAKTQFRPSVTSNGTLGKQRSDFSGSNATSDNNQISLNLDLPLFDRAKRIQVDQAELQVANAELQFFIARDDLTLRVAERYFNLLAARDAKEVARLQKIAIKRQMDLAAERLDVGLGTRTDLFDARARFEQANADVIAVDILINNSRQALIEIIAVTKPGEVSCQPGIVNRFLQGNLCRNTERRIIEIAVATAVRESSIDVDEASEVVGHKGGGVTQRSR